MSVLPFVETLPAPARARLAELGSVRTVSAGSPMVLEGDLGNRVWVIRTGLVKVIAVHRDGVEVVTALRGPGELIGELAVLDDAPRSASAIALLATDVQVLSAADFLGFLRSDPDAALTLSKNLAMRLRESDALRLGQAAEDVTQRLARCLVDLARRHGSPGGGPNGDATVVIDLPLTQTDLAAIVGSSRDAVAKTLQSWRDRDLVRTSRRRIELVDIGTLERRHRL